MWKTGRGGEGVGVPAIAVVAVAVVAVVDTGVELGGNPAELLECGRLQRC